MPRHGPPSPLDILGFMVGGLLAALAFAAVWALLWSFWWCVDYCFDWPQREVIQVVRDGRVD